MVSEREDCGHRRFPLLPGSYSSVIFPEPVMSWTASTPSDGSLEGLTLVRRELQRRQPPGVKPAYEPDLLRARFCLLKRHDHLTASDGKRLERLFAAHPRLRVAWDALQELYGLYQANDLQGALATLQRFAGTYETGQIPEYHNTVDTILNWADEILNWHHSRRSNGPLEGTNNLIQTLRRTAHGFTNPQNYAARGLLLT